MLMVCVLDMSHNSLVILQRFFIATLKTLFFYLLLLSLTVCLLQWRLLDTNIHIWDTYRCCNKKIANIFDVQFSATYTWRPASLLLILNCQSGNAKRVLYILQFTYSFELLTWNDVITTEAVLANETADRMTTNSCQPACVKLLNKKLNCIII